MKKETVSYIRHIVKSDYVQVDLLNALISIAIIVTAVVALTEGGNISIIGIEFILAGVLALFNLVKSLMKRSMVGILAFSGLMMSMIVATFIIYGYLL